MAINKIPGATSPDPVLYNSSYDQHALARIAHINEALRLLKTSVKTVGPVGAGATLAQVQAKLDALILALSS